jgi:hypothetical protein
MEGLRKYFVLSIFLCIIIFSCAFDGFSAQEEDASPPKRGARRRSRYESTFTDEEEAFLRSKQGETVELLTQLLQGKSEYEIKRRCLELGLRCGGNPDPLPRDSERWKRYSVDL